MKTLETEESPGVTSSMRVTLKHARKMEALYMGSAVALCVVAAVVGVLAIRANASYGVSVATGILAVAGILAAAGAGQKAVVTAAKAWQAKSEPDAVTTPQDLGGVPQ